MVLNAQILQDPPLFNMGGKQSTNNTSQVNSKIIKRRGSFEHNDQIEKQVQPSQFNDDDEINMYEGKFTNEKSNMDLKQQLKLQIKTTQKVIKLDSKKSQVIPIMTTIKSLSGLKLEEKSESAKNQQKQKQRPGIDLICAIDVSGSMSGAKIQLVKKSMKYLLELLGQNDRLSIVTFQSFAQRLCPLLRNTPNNRAKLQKCIESLSARGGTNINSGMDLAFRILDQKKFKNNVESIFLLSDGIDSGSEKKVQANLNTRIPLLKKSAFSIHSFGYGSDHDPKLMKEIANLRDGNFFYIQKYQTLDEAFANSLGGLFSVIAQEIDITIKCKAKGMFADIKITKAFGDITVYNPLKDQYNIHLTQFLSGISKNFVLQLTVPGTTQKVGDLERNQILVEARAVIKPLEGKEIVTIEDGLNVTFLNEDQELKQQQADPDVIENYMRVKAVEVMKENIKLIEQKKFEEAEKNISLVEEEISNNKFYKKSDKIQNLRGDMNRMKQQLKSKDIANVERFAVEVERAHSRQKNYNYQNSMQSEMVYKAKTRK